MKNMASMLKVDSCVDESKVNEIIKRRVKAVRECKGLLMLRNRRA
jgi:hypothetical protein